MMSEEQSRNWAIYMAGYHYGLPDDLEITKVPGGWFISNKLTTNHKIENQTNETPIKREMNTKPEAVLDRKIENVQGRLNDASMALYDLRDVLQELKEYIFKNQNQSLNNRIKIHYIDCDNELVVEDCDISVDFFVNEPENYEGCAVIAVCSRGGDSAKPFRFCSIEWAKKTAQEAEQYVRVLPRLISSGEKIPAMKMQFSPYHKGKTNE